MEVLISIYFEAMNALKTASNRFSVEKKNDCLKRNERPTFSHSHTAKNPHNPNEDTFFLAVLRVVSIFERISFIYN